MKIICKTALMMMTSALMLASCSQGGEEAKVRPLDKANFNESVKPSEDFYEYATGGWQKANPLKPEYARFGMFDQIVEDNNVRLNELFQSMTTLKAGKGSVEQKISDLYKMGLDSLRLNEEGARPLLPYVEAIRSASDRGTIVDVLADMHKHGAPGFFSCYVGADMMDSDIQVLYLDQGGLGMRDRDYYLNPANEALKTGYKHFLEAMFKLVDTDNPYYSALNALAVEDVIANNSWTREEMRDVKAQYNPMTAAELYKNYPGFDFKRYFSGLGIGDPGKVIIGQPSYFLGFTKYFANEDLSILKDYLVGMITRDACSALSDDFYAAYFDFFSTQMSGIQQQRPRWKRAMSVPNGILGEAVGKMYVEKYFPESSKKKMTELVKNLETALSQHIDGLDWMGDETKAKAQEKLQNFTVKIGYPDKWKDYSGLDINPEASYYENLRAASAWYREDNLSKLGKKTDRTEWGMSPQTVNAYYNPSTNEICFPAAILQPPFFNPDADDAVNYGGIGVVIGHEMSHGFDDQGRLFDKSGNMVSWWTPADEAKFKQKAQVLVSQFDEVEILPGLHANGTYTLGENIGDHGGLSIAYTALENALEGKSRGKIDGFTPEQRFYLSYATIWAQNITEEEMRRRTNQDVHSLAKNRVNVSVKNFQTFFDAFGIKEGDPMYRPEAERVSIW